MEEIATIDALAATPERMAQKLRDADWTDTMLEIQGELERDHEENFRTATSPDGTPWPPLAASTVANKGHDTILVETGALGDSVAQPAAGFAIRKIIDDGDTKGLVFGTNRPHAAKHQHGTQKIPQRKFLGWTEETKQMAKQKILARAKQILTAEG